MPNNIAVTAIILNLGNDPVISTDVSLQSLIILENADLTIEANNTLSMHEFLPINSLGILLNQGTVTNNGEITISSTSGLSKSAIYNIGTFLNDPESTIDIENSYGNGIFSSGSFTNYGGTISIGTVGNVNGNGIVIDADQFTNRGVTLGNTIKGIINIDNTTSDGLSISANGA